VPQRWLLFRIIPTASAEHKHSCLSLQTLIFSHSLPSRKRKRRCGLADAVAYPSGSASSPNRLLDRRGLRFDGKTAGGDGGLESLEILFDLVRISHRIVGDRLVENVGSSQVTADRCGVPRFGVSPGKCPPAQVGVSF